MPYQVLPLDSSSRILGKDINPDLLPSVRMNVRKCLSSEGSTVRVDVRGRKHPECSVKWKGVT